MLIDLEFTIFANPLRLKTLEGKKLLLVNSLAQEPINLRVSLNLVCTFARSTNITRYYLLNIRKLIVVSVLMEEENTNKAKSE